MKNKFFVKKKSKILINYTLIALAIIFFISCSIYIKSKKSEVKSNYEAVLITYKTEIKKIMFNEVKPITLHNISLDFEALSQNWYLSKSSKQKSVDYMDFTKYLAYREHLYESLIELSKKKISVKNSSPNKLKTIVDDIDKTLNNMNSLYNKSAFIRDTVIKSPESMRKFAIYFGKVLSSTSEENLRKMIDDNFNKNLLSPEEVQPKYNKSMIEKLPKITQDEYKKKYMKELNNLSTLYKDRLIELNNHLGNIEMDQNSDPEVLNKHFLAWNDLLNKVWMSLQEHLPSEKLQEVERSQLMWIRSKDNKTKFEQVKMTQFRTLEIIKHYIYGQ